MTRRTTKTHPHSAELIKLAEDDTIAMRLVKTYDILKNTYGLNSYGNTYPAFHLSHVKGVDDWYSLVSTFIGFLAAMSLEEIKEWADAESYNLD